MLPVDSSRLLQETTILVFALPQKDLVVLRSLYCRVSVGYKQLDLDVTSQSSIESSLNYGNTGRFLSITTGHDYPSVYLPSEGLGRAQISV
jgi:hypothetical protein